MKDTSVWIGLSSIGLNKHSRDGKLIYYGNRQFSRLQIRQYPGPKFAQTAGQGSLSGAWRDG